VSLEDPQNAREYLLSVFSYLTAGGGLTDPEATAQEALEMCAHELAELIRCMPIPEDPDDYGGFVEQGAYWAANLIDPEVEA